ncbi:DUF1080 domain-containing protein [Prosthecobacter sp.]|uniref:DUF1080 domain-containing protein n=1 Tax=Prosthecobacter sp. TaxID=1965333 RepID=UPI0037837015
MKQRFFFTLFALAFSMAAFGEDFVPLFDGKTLAGWTNPFEWGQVDVVDGEIRLSSEKKFFLVTEKTYGDFVFEGDVFIPPGKANSGFMFRAHAEKGKVTGYQAEVDGDDARQWSGGLQEAGGRAWFASPIKGNKESEAAFRARAGSAFKRNDWNTYRIECRGKSLKIFVNGVLTTNVEDDKAASGVIGIQHHGEKGQTYRFRNLKILELK